MQGVTAVETVNDKDVKFVMETGYVSEKEDGVTGTKCVKCAR